MKPPRCHWTFVSISCLFLGKNGCLPAFWCPYWLPVFKFLSSNIMKQPTKPKVRLKTKKVIYSRGPEAGTQVYTSMNELDRWNAMQNFVGSFVNILFFSGERGSVTLKIWSNAYQAIIMGKLKRNHHIVSLNALGKRSHSRSPKIYRQEVLS